MVAAAEDGMMEEATLVGGWFRHGKCEHMAVIKECTQWLGMGGGIFHCGLRLNNKKANTNPFPSTKHMKR